MRKIKEIFSLFLLMLVATVVVAEAEYKSHYIGQEKRTIKSLSADDMKQLSQGKGWGLAKAAELNGMPGPAHVLQMKKEIALSTQQEEKIQKLFNEMKAEAVPLGEQLIALEKDLNEAFASRKISPGQLKIKLAEIADVRMKLRYVHLVTHLKTPTILTTRQVELYNELRGYGDGDPCTNVPKGHNPDMWKKHNGCS